MQVHLGEIGAVTKTGSVGVSSTKIWEASAGDEARANETMKRFRLIIVADQDIHIAKNAAADATGYLLKAGIYFQTHVRAGDVLNAIEDASSATVYVMQVD